MELTEFLLARIAEDEAWSRDHAATLLAREVQGDFSEGHNPCDPVRVLAECEAKRLFLSALAYLSDLPEGKSLPDVQSTLKLEHAALAMAAVYADHPDYRPDWRS